MSVMKKVGRIFWPKSGAISQVGNTIDNIGGNFSDLAKMARRNKSERPAQEIKNDFTTEQFKKMYRNARLTAFVVMGIALYAGVRLAFSESLAELGLSFAGFTLASLYYMTLVHRLYSARVLWMNWHKKSEGVYVTWLEFAQSTSESLLNIFPLPLIEQRT